MHILRSCNYGSIVSRRWKLFRKDERSERTALALCLDRSVGTDKSVWN